VPENTKSQLYEFGGFRLDPLRCRLYGSDGETIALKPKVFETLLYLVEHAGELLDKSTLMKGIWGDAVVEENSLNKHISTLRHVFGETPGENRYIVTVPGQGYRFVATVRTATRAESESPDARAGSVEATRDTPGSPPFRWLNRWYVLAGVAGTALLLVIAWSIRSPITATDTQTIAVLPFDNLSAGDDEYFSDGISVELTELLMKIPRLHVIGRESAFWFKGKEATYAEIGDTLGVTHLLDGTVRVAGDRVRVTASLIDPSTGEQIWSYSPEARPMADVFAIQEEIATDVVEQLRITLAGELPALDQTTPEAHRSATHSTL
jgi:TolB-like protein/DNA-binding winged helix-turn-helix (wHTH) protein